MVRRRLAALLLASVVCIAAAGAGAVASPPVRTVVTSEDIGDIAVDAGRVAWSERSLCGVRLRTRALSGAGATRSTCFDANRPGPIALAGWRVLWFEEAVGNTTYVGAVNVLDLRNGRSRQLCAFEIDTNYGERSVAPALWFDGAGSLLAYRINGQDECPQVGTVSGNRAHAVDTQLTAVWTLAAGSGRIAVGGDSGSGGRIELRSARGALIRALTVRGGIRSLSLSGDLLAVLVDKPANKIELFEVPTGRPLRPLTLPVPVREIAVSGLRIAALTSAGSPSLYGGNARRLHRITRVSPTAESLDLSGSSAVWLEPSDAGMDRVRVARIDK